MKKVISKTALRKEKAFWTGIKKAASERPARVCHK